ncbi:MAG: FkbM family methyltransferase [Bacteroidetes bacterium]|nr:FkbM family methyltransferase [Bacteroidota bacterium]
MTTKTLLAQLRQVENLAAAGKWTRMRKQPFKYFKAILFRELVYKKSKKERPETVTTFFGVPMHILLPSSTDIYLTGGKSHASEIRLARFLIINLKQNAVFLDIGAHYGYFSLLASRLVGDSGKIVSIEAAPATYKMLHRNKLRFNNIFDFNLAVSDTAGHLSFFEFPNLYSEYNTLDIRQFENEPWFAANAPTEIRVPAIELDAFLAQENLVPEIIKIDVEGAEYKVLKGATHFLQNHAPIIVMEYLSPERSNTAHQEAEALLKHLGFKPYAIDHHGHLQELEDVHAHLKASALESDNIAFVKTAGV